MRNLFTRFLTQSSLQLLSNKSRGIHVEETDLSLRTDLRASSNHLWHPFFGRICYYPILSDPTKAN